ncbi:MAG: thioredoxin [Candidatus Eisenbacteria bacterium]
MSGKPADINDSDFEDQVLKAEGVVLVDFWAPWCAPCRVVSPVVEEIAESMGDSMKVCKVNVDENPVSSQKYGIRAIPTLIVFKGGDEAARMVGVRPREEIEKEIKAAIT